MRKSPFYWLTVTLMVVVASTIAYAQLSYTPPSFAPKQVIPSATFNTLFNTIDQEALNRTGGTMTGNLIWSPDGTGSIGAAGATRPGDIHVADDVFIGDALSVTGASTLAAVSATNGTFSGTLGVTGASTLAALSATTGTFSSTLGVTGATTLAALSATTGTFSSTLGVTGASTFTTGTFSSTLGVTGLTTLTGGATSAGDIRISAAAPNLRIHESDQAADAKQWLIRSFGSVLSILAVNDAESSGTDAVTISRSGNSPVLTTLATALALTKSRNITTADGEQTITLNDDDYTLRVTTGGTATIDQIMGFTGGVAGREIVVCPVSSESVTGGLYYSFNDPSATAADRLMTWAGTDGESDVSYVGHCTTFQYDGTSSAWRSK